MFLTDQILASRLNIYKNHDLSVSGEDLDRITTSDLHRIISRTSVFYRVSPKHKLTIVKVDRCILNESIVIFRLGITISRTYRWYDR